MVQALDGSISPPTARIEAVPRSVTAGGAVAFFSVETPGSAPILNREWVLEPGATSNERDPTHLYQTPGYVPGAARRARRERSRRDRLGAHCCVGRTGAGVAGGLRHGRAHGHRSQIPPTTNVHFVCTASDPENTGVLDYSWDLGDETTANTAEVDHTYADVDTYFAICRVTDGNDNTGTGQIEVSVGRNGIMPPRILTVPSLDAICLEPYAYNEGNVAVARGGGTITWRAGKTVAGQETGAPTGFTVGEATGTIAWVPTDAQVGVVPVVLAATNSVGSGVQEFDVTITCEDPEGEDILSSHPVGCTCNSTPLTVLLLGVLALPLLVRRRSGRRSS